MLEAAIVLWVWGEPPRQEAGLQAKTSAGESLSDKSPGQVSGQGLKVVESSDYSYKYYVMEVNWSSAGKAVQTWFGGISSMIIAEKLRTRQANWITSSRCDCYSVLVHAS